MLRSNFSTRPRTAAVALGITTVLAACGGGGEEATTQTVAAADQTDTSDAAPTGGQNPFTEVIDCLNAEGLQVDDSAISQPGGQGGPPGGGSPPADGSIPEDQLPGGSIPDGAFPGGSIPEDGFPGGSVPDGGFPGGARPDGGFGAGEGDGSFLANALGLDGDDPEVAAALEACTTQSGT